MMKAIVTFFGDEGSEKGEVVASVASSAADKYVGLSDADELQDGKGMVFPYKTETERTFVMRDMNFGLDIIHIASNGEISRIYEAPPPPENASNRDLERYPGVSIITVEVPIGWCDKNNILEGDSIEIEYQK